MSQQQNSATPAAASPARLELLRRLRPKAPPLALPRGAQHREVPVATVAELTAAIRDAQPGDVILVADGRYEMPCDVLLCTPGVTLAGASGDPAKVVLDGTAQHLDVDISLLSIKRAQQVTIANLTFQNARKYGLRFYGDSQIRDLHVYNCRFHNIWARGIKGTHPACPEDSRAMGLHLPEITQLVRPKNGCIEYCDFTADKRKDDLTDGFDGDYISGMDMMGLDHWRVAHNLFYHLQGAHGKGRGGVFIWVGSNDLTIEDNIFVDCDRAIALGNPSQQKELNVDRAVVRRNRIVNGAFHALECHTTRDVHACANRIVATQTEFPAIEWKFGSSGGRLEGCEIRGPVDIEKEVHQLSNEHTPAPVAFPDNAALERLLRPL